MNDKIGLGWFGGMRASWPLIKMISALTVLGTAFILLLVNAEAVNKWAEHHELLIIVVGFWVALIRISYLLADIRKELKEQNGKL